MAPTKIVLSCIPDIFLSYQSEESIWKRDFLQASFFNRKRSNSNENNSLSVSSSLPNPPPGPALPAEPLPTPSNTNSSNTPMDTTTWARFKGKVNQAMEDIKSSSSTNTQKGTIKASADICKQIQSSNPFLICPLPNSLSVGITPTNLSTADSVNVSQIDVITTTTTTAQSSISEDYQDLDSATNGDADNSDDDVDSEIFNGPDEVEAVSSTTNASTSRLKRSMRHLHNNKEAIKGSLRKAKATTKDVFSRRDKRTEAAAAPKLDSSSIIDTGVEMVEDMEPTVLAAVPGDVTVSLDNVSAVSIVIFKLKCISIQVDRD